MAITKRIDKGAPLTAAEHDANVDGFLAVNRIKNSTIGASYTLVDALHFSKILYTPTSGSLTVTLQTDQASITEGFLSFHVNIGGGEVVIAYDDTLIEVIGHDPVNDDPLKVKPLVDEPSKGGVQIDYIGFNSTTSKMEYHVYGALV